MANDVVRFPFVSVRNAQRETLLRPLLPIALSYRGHAITASGLLDTGADVNVLPYPVGAQLGAVWDEQRTAITLSGNLAHYEARGIIVEATVGEFVPVRLAFAWTRAEAVPLILGQVNFFAEFNVCFFRSELAFEVRVKGQ